jgi:O-antigen/teichoic acid export membrane protein
MQLLGVAFLPFFILNPFPFLLTALHDQRFLLWTTLLSLALRVALNFALIPPLKFIGPSVAFLAGEIALLTVLIVRLAQLGYPLALGALAWRPLLAAGAMGFVLHLSQGHSPWWFFAASSAGCGVYALLLFKLGAFTADELDLAREGLSFMKPLIAKWTSQPQPKVS